MNSHDYDTREERPAHDSSVDRSDLIHAIQSDDKASRLVERVGAVVIILLIVAAIVKAVMP